MTSRRPTVGSARNGAIVVDSSITAAWCFEDEVSPLIEVTLDEVVRGGALVPAIWLVEMANVLVVAERRGRVDSERADQLLATVLALPVMVEDREPHVLGPAIVRVARAEGLTAYDAAYLELAMRARLALATRDTTLRDSGRTGRSEPLRRLSGGVTLIRALDTVARALSRVRRGRRRHMVPCMAWTRRRST